MQLAFSFKTHTVPGINVSNIDSSLEIGPPVGSCDCIGNFSERLRSFHMYLLDRAVVASLARVSGPYLLKQRDSDLL
jgi:hypothetical protein